MDNETTEIDETTEMELFPDWLPVIDRRRRGQWKSGVFFGASLSVVRCTYTYYLFYYFYNFQKKVH